MTDDELSEMILAAIERANSEAELQYASAPLVTRKYLIEGYVRGFMSLWLSRETGKTVEYEYGIGWSAEHGVWNPKESAEKAVEAMEYQREHYPGDKPYYALRRVKATAPGPWEKIT